MWKSLLLVCLLASVAEANIEWGNPWPQGNDLNGVWSNGKDVFVVGGSGTLLASADAGKTWRRLSTGTSLALFDIWGAGTELYIAADQNTILKSIDAGRSWKATNPPTGVTTALYGVWGAGPDEVYVAGVNGAIAHSADRGKTWVSQNVQGKYGYSTLYDIWGSGKEVWIAGEGGTVLVTKNGGATWSKASGSGESLQGIAGVGKRRIAVGGAGRILQVDPDRTREPKPVTTRILRDVWSDGTIVVAVGETEWSKAVNATRGTILRSADAGATWKAIDSAAAHHLSAIWGDAKALWAVGESGVVVRSRDAGLTWAAVGKSALDGEVESFAGDGKNVLAGASGLARSTDGGATWTQLATGYGVRVAAVPGAFVAIGTLGKADGVHRSVDGGTTWGLVKKGGTTRLEAIASVDKLVLVVGDRGTIARSDDAGLKWTTATSGGKLLQAVSTDGREAYATDGTAVFRSADAGKTWIAAASPATGTQVRGLWNGGGAVIAVGTEASGGGRGDHAAPRAFIARSVDHGRIWHVQWSSEPYSFDAISGRGSVLWIGGGRGVSMQSTDAGKTWKKVVLPTVSSIHGIWTDGKVVLFGGSTSEIWRGP